MTEFNMKKKKVSDMSIKNYFKEGMKEILFENLI